MGAASLVVSIVALAIVIAVLRLAIGGWLD